MKERISDASWLREIFEGAGLDPEPARTAADAAREKILRRVSPRPPGESRAPLGRISAAFVRDPIISLNRITGIGDDRLPFVDIDTGKLSELAFTQLFAESGMEGDVALAFAKVVVEAYEPADFYAPVWSALGQSGPVDLDRLRKLDWSPIRLDLPSPPGPRPALKPAVHPSAASPGAKVPPPPKPKTPPRTPTASSPSKKR